MQNIVKVGKRNKVDVQTRRYNLSDMISESYRLLYECEIGSPLYRLIESHISNVRKDPTKIESLSRDLSTLKGLCKLGESAIIKESDIPQDTQEFTDEMSLEQKNLDKDRDVEELEGADVIEEDNDVSEEDEEIIEETEESEDDVIEENDASDEEESEETIVEEEENPEDEITPEELKELKKHLLEIRRAKRVKESRKVTAKKSIKETRSWSTEKSSMSVALQHFRESSANKAFYNTFSKMQSRLKSTKPLSLQESILLFKAANSAMTQLAVELEHNPDFIYTFKECTSILSQDTEALLSSIQKHKSPKTSVTKSLLEFSSILLDSEDPDYGDYEEEEIVETEENAEEMVSSEEDEKISEEEDIVDEEDSAEEEITEEEESTEEIPVEENEEEVPAEDTPVEENEELPSEEEVIVEEEPVDDEEIVEENDEEVGDITDEEAQALKAKLMELRKANRG